MRLASGLLASVPFLALVPFSLSACTERTTDGPESGTVTAGTPADVARAFFEAARDGDTAGFEGLLTKGAREGLQTGGGGIELEGNVQAFEVGAVVMNGGEATVPIRATLRGEEQDLGLRMRNEEDAWRVWGFDVSVGGEAAMTIDLEELGGLMSAMQTGLETAFEDAFEDVRMGGSPEEIRAARDGFDAIASVAAPEHDATWKVDVSAEALPARDVLATLFDGSGVAIDAGGHADALAAPVSLELSGISRLEAVERVCEEVALHPLYPDLGWTNDDSGPSVSFGAGPRPYPVSFTGPFLIEVASLEENAPFATGSLTLAVRSLGLAPGVLAFQTEMCETLAVTDIRDDGGNSVNADEDTTFYGTPQVDEGLFGDSTSFSLRNLLRGVEEIDVRGSVHLRFPTWVVSTRFEAKDVATKTVGDLLVSRKEWGESTSFEVTGAKSAESLSVRLAPEGAGGEPMGSIYSDSSGWGEVVRASLQTPEAPAAVALKLCTVTEVEHAFELGGIPLSRNAEQPEELAALTFSGDAPLTVEFVRFVERGDFPRVELRISNVSNKDTENASATFVYLDAAGKELETFPHLLSGEFDFEGQKPLAGQGATVTQETQAAFAPAETASIRVRVDEVTFVDASEWAPAD